MESNLSIYLFENITLTKLYNDCVHSHWIAMSDEFHDHIKVVSHKNLHLKY